MLLLARLRFLRAPTGSSVLHSSYSIHFLLSHPSSSLFHLVLLRLFLLHLLLFRLATASCFFQFLPCPLLPRPLLLRLVPASRFDCLLLLPVPTSSASASCSHANVHHAASDPSSRPDPPYSALPIPPIFCFLCFLCFLLRLLSASFISCCIGFLLPTSTDFRFL